MEMYSLNSIYICAVEVALRFLLCLRTLAISAMSTHGLVRTRFSLGSFTLSGNCSGFWFLVPVGLRIRIAVWTASVSNKHKNKLTYRLSINNDSYWHFPAQVLDFVSGAGTLVDHVEVSAGDAELAELVQGRTEGEPIVGLGHLHRLAHEIVQNVDWNLQLLVDLIPAK